MVLGLSSLSPLQEEVYSASFDGIAVRWDARTGTPLTTFHEFSTAHWLYGVGLSHDGQVLYTCGDNRAVRHAACGTVKTSHTQGVVVFSSLRGTLARVIGSANSLAMVLALIRWL